MSKIVLNAVADLTSTTTAQTTINNNSNTIQTAFDNTLSRDGTSPNQMSAPLDMNSNHVINLPAPTSNFDAVRLLDVTSLGTGGTITVNPLPTGGTTGQVLSKNSNANFDAGWSAVTTGVNITSGKTLSATNTLTLSGTDGTTQTFPSITDTIAGVNAVQTLSNKTVNTASGNTLAINGVPLTSTTGSGGSAVLANVPTIASPTITGAFTATNLVTNADLTQSPAVTFKGNPTNATANATDFTTNSLTTLSSPDATNDYVVIWDHTAGTLKKANPTAISGAAVAGVASIAGNTGVFTLGNGLTNSANIILADATYHRGYLAGCTLSNDVSPTQIIDISAGVVCSDDNSTLMKTAGINKATAGTWVVGSANGLDTGTVAASTWYHVYIISRLDTGVVDALISTSATSPTMPTNYTVKRRIGSFKTDGSSNILAFTQVGDEFLWTTPVLNLDDGANSTTAALITMTTPLGVKVQANFSATCRAASSTANSAWFSSPDEADTAPFSLGANFNADLAAANVGAVVNYNAGRFLVRTNTSSQIRKRNSLASGGTTIVTRGWVDTRGRFS